MASASRQVLEENASRMRPTVDWREPNERKGKRRREGVECSTSTFAAYRYEEADRFLIRAAAAEEADHCHQLRFVAYEYVVWRW